jgi:hypothetical protein
MDEYDSMAQKFLLAPPMLFLEDRSKWLVESNDHLLSHLAYQAHHHP